jgi:hypothetical protein
MAKRKNSQAEFVKWFGPLLDALRDLDDPLCLINLFATL